MADNARLHDHEKLIAADEINNIKHLRFKVQYGEEDSATDVSSTNPMPVAVSSTCDSPVYTNVCSVPENLSETLGLNYDAFGRLRISNPFTLFDSSFRYRDNTYKWNSSITNNSGIAAVNHSSNESTIYLSIGTSNGDSIIRETKRVFSYQSGKSLLILTTFVFANLQTNLRQRVGYFGVNDGIYFTAESNSIYMVIRKSISGSVDDSTEKIAQNDWNVDDMSGNGGSSNPSGIELDLTKPQILFIDVEWLGVGTVRTGFVIDGKFITVHKFHHANSMGSGVYMKTANLPIRYEIANTGVTSTNSTMKQICSTVISEGGYTNQSVTKSASTNITGKNLNNGVYNPLVCIRLKSTNLDAVVVPTTIETYGLQNTAFKWALILNPTLTDASFTTAGSDSSVEYDISSTALSGGTILSEGVFSGGNKGGGDLIGADDVGFTFQLGRTIGGTADILCLAAYPTSNNDDAIGIMSWQEH